MSEDATYCEMTLELPTAVPFIRDSLAARGLALGRIVLEHTEFESGTVRTWCPIDSQQPTSRVLEEGGFALGRETYDWLVRTIGQYLGLSADRVCILADTCSRPGDPHLPDWVLFLEEEAYHPITSTENTPETIERRVGQAECAAGLVGVMGVIPPDQEWAAGSGVISLGVLRALGQHAEGVIVSAFDGEGYLVWTPD